MMNSMSNKIYSRNRSAVALKSLHYQMKLGIPEDSSPLNVRVRNADATCNDE